MSTDRGAAVANRPAVAAFVIGLLSLPAALTYVLGVVFGLAAVVLGFAGVAKSRQLDAAGEGLSVAGIVLGMLGMALPVAMALFLSD